MQHDVVEQKDQTQILLVDDNTLVLEQVGQMLQGFGVKTKSVENGELALAALRSFHFHLVLLDWQMPVLCGYETAKAIRESDDSQLKVIPIVAMTGFKLNTSKHLMDGLKIDGFLKKPFDSSALMAVLSRCLNLVQPISQGLNRNREQLTAFDSESILDFQYLESWMALDASKGQEMLVQIVGKYLTSATHIESKLKSALLSSDRHSLALSLHKLRGSSGQIGAKRLMSVCEHIEKNIFSLSQADLETSLTLMNQISMKTQKSLTDLLV